MTEIYYQNLLSDRKATLWLLEKQIKTTRTTTNLSNGRSLNRLSTKQLVAKKRILDNNYTKRVIKYVTFLDGPTASPSDMIAYMNEQQLVGAK